MSKAGHIPRIKTKARGRSAVSNNSRLFVDPKARGPWARRFADLCSDLVQDLGGLDAVTTLRMQLVRRAAALCIEAERLEGELAHGREIDVDLLSRLTGQLRRVTEQLGLDKAPVKRPPSIADIAERIAREKAAQK